MIALRQAVLPMLLATLLATAARGQDTTRAAPRNFVAVDLGYTDFSDDTDPWQVGSLSIGRRTDAGPVIARVNRATRFDRSGAQLELDAYPRLSPTAYIYLNAGWSESPVFPHWRAGGELYGAPARGVELSAGYRQLRFTGVSVNLLTGSAGLYRGDYWVAVRPFLRLDGGARDLSASLVARRYFSGADDYVGLVLGAGATPRDARADVDLLSTRHGAVSAGVQGSRPLASRVTATWAATGERERFQAGVSRTRVELTLGGRLDY